MNYKIADDFVVASKQNYSVKDFINLTCKNLGIKILWSGKGLKETGKDSKGRTLINVNKKFFRPSDVNNLFGNPSKAIRKLKWKKKYDLNALIKDMILFEKKKYFK